MRKYLTVLALILSMSLLLFGCGQDTESTESTTETTEATQATETQATEETSPEPSISLETQDTSTHVFVETEPSEPDYTPYYELLSPNNEGNALLDAMNCSFIRPEEMNLAYVFYGSLAPGGWDTISEESVAQLEAAGFSKNLELQIRPAKELEAVLKSSFGISLKDVTSGIPESWVYVKEDDCYYTNHSDALGFPDYTITWVDSPSNDRIEISYTIESDRWYDTASKTYLDHPNMIMTLQIKENGDYQMLSNYAVPSK